MPICKKIRFPTSSWSLQESHWQQVFVFDEFSLENVEFSAEVFGETVQSHFEPVQSGEIELVFDQVSFSVQMHLAYGDKAIQIVERDLQKALLYLDL